MAPSLPFFSRSSLSRKEGGVIAAHHTVMRRRGRVLPSNFTPVEYLQSSGTQYINTGVAASAGISIGVKVQRTANNSDWDGIVGSWTAEDNTLYACSIRYNGTAGTKLSPSYGGTPDSSTRPNISSGQLVELVLTQGTFSLDGVVYCTWTPNVSALSSFPFFCFVENKGGSPWNGRYLKGRIYYLWIMRDGKLVFDAIPVREGTTGYLYDFVSKSALGNAGTGTFTYGSDIDFNG